MRIAGKMNLKRELIVSAAMVLGLMGATPTGAHAVAIAVSASDGFGVGGIVGALDVNVGINIGVRRQLMSTKWRLSKLSKTSSAQRMCSGSGCATRMTDCRSRIFR